MAVHHNLDQAFRILAELGHALDFDRDGLADESFDALATSIQSRFLAESGPDEPFAANRGKYGERKRGIGVPVGIGLHGNTVGGEMAKDVHFLGQREVTPEAAVLAFGADDANRRKGMWFESGAFPDPGIEPSGAAGQPRREFFGLNEDDEAKVMDIIGAHVDRFLEAL